MRKLIILLSLVAYLPSSHADTKGCEIALIDAMSSEEEIASGEDRLFQVSEKAELPRDFEWIKKASQRILASKDRIGAESAFALYTALLAGLDYAGFADPKFDREILKPWAALRKEARRIWTYNPPRYNIRLMYKLSMARLFDYLYS